MTGSPHTNLPTCPSPPYLTRSIELRKGLPHTLNRWPRSSRSIYVATHLDGHGERYGPRGASGLRSRAESNTLLEPNLLRWRLILSGCRCEDTATDR